MEEQGMPAYPKGRNNKTVPLIVVLILIAAAALGAYFLIARTGGAGDPASFIPQDVAIAITLDFRGSTEKNAAMDFIHGVLKDAGVKETEQDLFSELSKKLKMDFEKDVVGHLSGTAALAIMNEPSGMLPQLVAAIGARSDGDASALIKTLGDKLNANKVGFELKKYEGFHYYAIPIPGASTPLGQIVNYVGAVKNCVVFADTETAYKKMVDTVGGKPSLLSDKNYAKLRKPGTAVFATAYYSGEGFYKFLSPYLALAAAAAPPEQLESIKEAIQSNIAAVTTAQAGPDGIIITMDGVTKQQSAELRKVKLDELAATAPKDAVFAFAMSDWASAWKEAKKQMDKQPTQRTQFAEVATQVKMATGLDLGNDILDRIVSGAAYYVPKAEAKSKNFPGEMTVILKVDKPDLVNKTLNKVHAKLAAVPNAPKMKPASIAGEKMFSGAIGKDGDMLRDGVIGDKLVVTATGPSSSASVNRAIAVAKGKADTLASSNRFKIVKSQLGDEAKMYFYGDIGTLLKALGKDMSAKERKIAEKVTSKIGVFGLTADAGADTYEMRIVIPFAK
ncbi:MAG: DUF3352 domain-containing protein [Armatimonadetes bacterium]|nr:DUF3352 domain-containing protein [Armatimonadota bacterium]